MRRALRAAALAATLLAAAPAAARAQSCAGLPLGDTRVAVGVLVGTASHDIGAGVDASEIGVAVHGRPAGRLSASLELALRTPEGGALDITVLRSAVRLPLATVAGLEACPLVGVGVASVSDGAGTSYTSLTLPLGVTLGLPVELGNVRLFPFAAPQLLLATVGGEVLGGSVEAEGYSAALEAGVGIRLGGVVGGLRVLVSQLDAALGTPAHPNRGAVLWVGWGF
jgi:hypothetical protein